MTEKIAKFFIALVTPSPARDWLVLLVILLCCFTAFMAYAAYLFLGIRSGSIVGEIVAPVEVLPNVSRADLMGTLEHYRVRRANFESGDFGIR